MKNYSTTVPARLDDDEDEESAHSDLDLDEDPLSAHGSPVAMGVDANDSISVRAFKEILRHSAKKYPVDSVVQELDPQNTGFISFHSIHNFSGLLQTVSIDAFAAKKEKKAMDQ